MSQYSRYSEGGGIAFPMAGPMGRDIPGMSMRQWYAGQALAGLLANPHLSAMYSELEKSPAQFNAIITTAALEFADALLEAEQ